MLLIMVNHKNNAGKTPLHEAAADGKLDIVNLFVSSEADVNILDNEGNTAFDLGKKHVEVASYLGHVMGSNFFNDNKYEDALKIYKELLEIQTGELGDVHSETLKTLKYVSGVQTILHNSGHSIEKPVTAYAWKEDLAMQNHDGKTPLHIAAETGMLHDVKMFVTLGAKLDILDNDGKTAFELGKKYIEVAEYLGHIMRKQFLADDKYEDALKINEELCNILKERINFLEEDDETTRIPLKYGN